MSSTIFALSTPPGRSGVAVVRLSGPETGATLRYLTQGDLPPPRQAVLRRLYDAESETLDRGLVLWFPAPRSFTGEDMAELQVHGSHAVIQEITTCLATSHGLTPAEPGAFTRRAFDNAKLDLTEVEGLADLIEAETTAQRRQALRQLDGYLSTLVTDWRTRLTRTLAHFEAAIDFSDEDLPETLMSALNQEIADLEKAIAAVLEDNRRGERLRDGFRIAILGAPNAGKSSLLNALVRRDAAIVADTAGTTRDVVEVHMDLGGYPVMLADTAGLRVQSVKADPIEKEGIRRALNRAADADLKLALFDSTDPGSPDTASLSLVDEDTLVVATKIDKCLEEEPETMGAYPCFAISAETGRGLNPLLTAIRQAVANRADSGNSAPAITRARHRQALDETQEALRRAQTAPLPELAAEDLRLASRSLGRITGSVDVEDLLDVIFADFCIGK